MAAKKGGLGRGLDALFADNSIEEISSTGAVKLKTMDTATSREKYSTRMRSPSLRTA